MLNIPIDAVVGSTSTFINAHLCIVNPTSTGLQIVLLEEKVSVPSHTDTVEVSTFVTILATEDNSSESVTAASNTFVTASLTFD